MRKIFILFMIFSLSYTVCEAKSSSSLPNGIFKKKHNGYYVQYDSNGKKIGVYKISKGKLEKVR